MVDFKPATGTETASNISADAELQPTTLDLEGLATDLPEQEATASKDAGSEADSESEVSTSKGAIPGRPRMSDGETSAAENKPHTPNFDSERIRRKLAALSNEQSHDSRTIPVVTDSASTVASLAASMLKAGASNSTVNAYQEILANEREFVVLQMTDRAKFIEDVEQYLVSNDPSYGYQDLHLEYPVPQTDAGSGDGLTAFGKTDIASLGSLMADIHPHGYTVVRNMLQVSAKTAQMKRKLRALEREVASKDSDLERAYTESAGVSDDQRSKLIYENAAVRMERDKARKSLEVLSDAHDHWEKAMVEDRRIKDLGNIRTFLTKLHEPTADSPLSEGCPAEAAFQNFTESQRVERVDPVRSFFLGL